MREKHIDKRLQAICDAVPATCRVLLDVGTDHGYVPISLVRSQKIEYAIASDISAASLNKAEREVSRNELSENIECRVGSGLEVLKEDDQVDTVVIAGMGGVLISRLLEDAKSLIRSSDITFVLQPVQGVKELRDYLKANHFIYIEERLIKSLDKFYQILVCKYREGFEEDSLREYYELSPAILNVPGMDLVEYARFRLKEMDKIISGLEKLKEESGLNEERRDKLNFILEKRDFYKKVEEDALKGIDKKIG